ncbi:Glycerol-3-phosphate acyltransferase 9 [Vitis vinifera]|uniref:Glycerol-3-phosphate acyltransferase 9 n=1 Tax=Vitis vinifera TaxID=29760 RepID=A0A438IIU1_VITVI|nr:Glycerol-3-phosphate acyltransferase 9 [Vitis vinifera]
MANAPDNKLTSSSSELDLDRPNLEDYLPSGSMQEPRGKLRLRDLLDISPTLTEAAGAIVDDSFTRCFKSNPPEPWNWNVYLFPLWCLGVRCLVELICSFFVASWTGVVKYHGPRPSRRPKQVFVANHTSMIDFIVLEQMTAFAVIMQKHPGWVVPLTGRSISNPNTSHCPPGIVLKDVSGFNRTEAKDREIVARKLRDHVQGADNNPLLIFPEGTCVNNHYTVMFKKKGHIGRIRTWLHCCPIAIKQSFTMHLLQLMTSWAVVCDVWYLEPQTLKPGETPIEFAERVRDIISLRAGLKKVPWDGILKYSRPSPKHREQKQQSFADSVLRRWKRSDIHITSSEAFAVVNADSYWTLFKADANVHTGGPSPELHPSAPYNSFSLQSTTLRTTPPWVLLRCFSPYPSSRCSSLRRELRPASNAAPAPPVTLSSATSPPTPPLYPPSRLSSGSKTFETLLGANSLPASTPTNQSVAAKDKIVIPFRCRCSNGTGISNHRPVYTVQKDDGLYHIAAEVFAGLVTYQEIQAVNNISDANLIEVGQELWIPLPCSCDEVNGSKVVHYGHVVESGSSVKEIAEKYGTTEEKLLELTALQIPRIFRPVLFLMFPSKNTSLDYPLLLSNGTYAYTANNCVKCQCHSANNWTLQCEQSGLNITNGTCPSMECGSSGLSIGNSTSTTCNRTTCAYAGYTNQTIFTSLVESTCSSTNNAPSYASKITLPSWRWNFVFIVSQLVMLYLHHSQ